MDMFRPSDIFEIENNLGETLNKLSGRTILLTGAGGFLGRYFMELFRSHNRKEDCNPIRVIALDSYVVGPEQKLQSIVENDENIKQNSAESNKINVMESIKTNYLSWIVVILCIITVSYPSVNAGLITFSIIRRIRLN